jgi:hypothetical protein
LRFGSPGLSNKFVARQERAAVVLCHLLDIPQESEDQKNDGGGDIQGTGANHSKPTCARFGYSLSLQPGRLIVGGAERK